MLEPLVVHLNSGTTDFKDYDKKEVNGWIECSKKDSKLKHLLLEYKDFSVTVYTLYQKFQDYRLILKFFKEFCTVNEKFVSGFIDKSNFFFKIGVYDVPTRQSEQTDLFLKLHKKWFYFEFDLKFEQIYYISEFRKNLEERFIYQTYDDEWEKIKVFVQVLTVDMIKKIFDTIAFLTRVEKVICLELEEKREKVYKEMVNQWEAEMPLKIETKFQTESLP